MSLMVNLMMNLEVTQCKLVAFRFRFFMPSAAVFGFEKFPYLSAKYLYILFRMYIYKVHWTLKV